VTVLTDGTPLERRLEFHDSTLIALHHAGDVARIEVDAYIHQWEGEGAARRGTGWIQRVTFELDRPVMEQIVALPYEIRTGHVRAASLASEDDGMLAVPLSLDEDCVLEFQNTTGEILRISARGLRAQPCGEARFVELLPVDMDDQKFGR
jgi:hypothetical protein